MSSKTYGKSDIFTRLVFRFQKENIHLKLFEAFKEHFSLVFGLNFVLLWIQLTLSAMRRSIYTRIGDKH